METIISVVKFIKVKFIELCYLHQEKIIFIKNQDLSNDKFQANKIINKFLLIGDKCMPEFHLKQP